MHISEIERLYSNYDVVLYGDEFALIETKKIYTHARSFARLIAFDHWWNYSIIINHLGELLSVNKTTPSSIKEDHPTAVKLIEQEQAVWGAHQLD